MRRIALALILLLLSQVVTSSRLSGPGTEAGAHFYTWRDEFDYISWVANAALLKLGQSALGAERYINPDDQSQLVRNYMSLVRNIQDGERQLSDLYANPDQVSVQGQIQDLDSHLQDLYKNRSQLAPLAESILQDQVTWMFAEYGFTQAGQTVPPLQFHSTPLPWALIASPRDRIAQVDNISLRTELNLEDHIAIEDQVAKGLNLSTLVVPVGGIGVYPTMVAQTSDLNWLTQTIAHEWTHNYLTLRPLGLSYYQNQDLTTMNETTANIVGKEIGAAVITRYYPELVPPPPAPAAQSPEQAPSQPPAFDFQQEMHTTRVHVDELLADGKIDEAEFYMEMRRQFFWDHGYAIRKLNQAYFAFYGSYADIPVGAAGEDPVGAAVRELRAQSSTLIQFVHRMAWLTSFDGLQKVLAGLDNGD